MSPPRDDVGACALYIWLHCAIGPARDTNPSTLFGMVRAIDFIVHASPWQLPPTLTGCSNQGCFRWHSWEQTDGFRLIPPRKGSGKEQEGGERKREGERGRPRECERAGARKRGRGGEGRGERERLRNGHDVLIMSDSVCFIPGKGGREKGRGKAFESNMKGSGNLNLTGNEVYYTACSLPVVLKNSCSELHHQKVLI